MCKNNGSLKRTIVETMIVWIPLHAGSSATFWLIFMKCVSLAFPGLFPTWTTTTKNCWDLFVKVHVHSLGKYLPHRPFIIHEVCVLDISIRVPNTDVKIRSLFLDEPFFLSPTLSRSWFLVIDNEKMGFRQQEAFSNVEIFHVYGNICIKFSGFCWMNRSI